MPPIPVPEPWHGLPVTPARLRWRVLRGSETVRAWHTPVDFRDALMPQAAYSRIYAPGTRQNHADAPGLYRFYLAHTWSTTLLPDGSYKLQAQAIDLAGNTATRTQAFTVANNV
jgi:hypothetical protein